MTYHGPGQLVAYPIMAVERIKDFVHAMERAIVLALADEGIESEVRETPFTGVWTDDRKIASIGVRVRNGVSTHGLAVKVNNDLQPFEWIVPCGIDMRTSAPHWPSPAWRATRTGSSSSCILPFV